MVAESGQLKTTFILNGVNGRFQIPKIGEVFLNCLSTPIIERNF